MDLKTWCSKQRQDSSITGRIIARCAATRDPEMLLIRINKGQDAEFDTAVTPMMAGIIRQFRRDGGILRYDHLFISVKDLPRDEGTVLKFERKPETPVVVDWRRIYADLLGIELDAEVAPISTATVLRFVPKMPIRQVR